MTVIVQYFMVHSIGLAYWATSMRASMTHASLVTQAEHAQRAPSYELALGLFQSLSLGLTLYRYRVPTLGPKPYT